MELLRNTWKSLQDFCAPLGNFASVAGVVVSLAGFYFTIRAARTARQAARRAEGAAIAARESILKSEAVAKFSSAISLMEDIKRLQRKKEWAVLLDRYSELRRLMIELQSEAIGLSANEVGVLGGAMSQLNAIEGKVEKTLSDGKPAPNIAKINEIVSQQISKIHGLSTKFRTT